MADQYIDELTALTTAADSDLLIINDVDDGANGTTKKITKANFLAGVGGGGGSSKDFLLSDQNLSGTTWTDISGIGTLNLDPSSTYVIRVKLWAKLVVQGDTSYNPVSIRYVATQRSGDVKVRWQALPYQNDLSDVDIRDGYRLWTGTINSNQDTQAGSFVQCNICDSTPSPIEATYILSTSTGSPTFKLQAQGIGSMDYDILAGGWYEVTKVA